VLSRSDQIAQVLDNLLENTARHAGERAKVDVIVEELEDDRVAVHVVDDGPGIPQENHRRIFARFFGSNEAGTQGLGVGLYVSRALTEELGGTLTVRSEPGRGATFTLALPRERASTNASAR
jgi:signal transduction histidine kinase